MDPHELEGQAGLQQVDNGTGAAVAGVDHQFQGPEIVGGHIAQQMLDIAALVVPRHQAPPPRHGAKGPGFRQGADLRQTVVAAHRAGPLPDKLDTVVIDGIVTGGHHQSPVKTPVKGGEVDLLGAALADPGDIAAGVADAVGHRLAEIRTGEANIVAHHDVAGVQHFGKGAADAVGDLRIELIGHPTADVVGLEAGQGEGHGAALR